jgi:hypothetical protein
MPKSAPKKIDPATVALNLDPTQTSAAYTRHKARALALTPGTLANATVNVPTAVAIATVGARNLVLNRDAVDAGAKSVPWDVIERVADVGLAAQHADMLQRIEGDEAAAFADLIVETDRLRSLLLADLDMLVRRGLVEEQVPAEIRKGDLNMLGKANDLRDATHYYTAHWKDVSARTSVIPEELTAADELATKILARLGAMHVAQTPKPGERPTSEMRRRMFTLLAQDYDVVQQYAAFAFWKLPAGWEAYAPSLWSGRRRSAVAAETGQPVTEPVTEPTKKTP